MIRKLIVGNGRSEREVLVVSNLLVGRDPACHISEPDPLLSRRHAEILAGTHGVSVRDLDSRNGVLVNGEKTREQVLFPGDVVQMGHLLLRYVEEASDAEPVERRRDRRAAPADDAAPAPTPFDRFKAEQDAPGRWGKEPTPMPGRGPAANETPSPRLKSITPLPRGRAAYDEATGIRPADPFLVGDRRRRQPEAPDDVEGVDPDATMLAPPGGIEPDGIVFVRETRPRRSGDAPVDVTISPGDSTFADAVARLASVVKASGGTSSPTHARLTVDAELRVVDATPECSALLGIPRESLVGDSLADVFLRGVRRAYVEYAATLSFHVTRGASGTIVVTMTMTVSGETK